MGTSRRTNDLLGAWKRLIAGRAVWLPTILAVAPVLLYAGFVLSRAGADLYLGGDQPVLEMGTRDALGLHADVGPYSRYGWSHPGPAVFYWFAPFYAAMGQRAAAMRVAATVMVLVGLAYIVRTVTRALGVSAGFVASVVVLGFLVISGVRWIDNAWNPVMVVVPVAVLGVGAAAVCEGRRWHLVTVGVAASFAAQTHVGTAPVVAALVAVAVVGLLLALRRDSSGWLRPLAVAGLVCTVMWALPVHQQITSNPGNMGQLVSFARQSPVSHSAADTLGPTSTQFTFTQTDLVETMRSAPDVPLEPWRAIAVGLLALALAGATVHSLRNRERFNAALTGGALLAGVGLAISLRSARGPLAGYLTLTATSIGLIAWLGLALTAAMAARGRPFAQWARSAAPAVALVAAVAACGFAVHAAGLPVSFTSSVPGAEVTVRTLESELGEPGPVLVTSGINSGVYASLVANQVERSGWDVTTTPALLYVWGDRRAATGCETAEIRVLTDDPVPPGFREVGMIGPASVYLGAVQPAGTCPDRG